MEIRQANKIIAEYMGCKFCLCLVNSIRPNPSSNHEYCLNEDCKKIITDDSYRLYASNLDLLIKVIDQLVEEQEVMEYMISGDGQDYLFESWGFSDKILQFSSNNIQETVCIGIAKTIEKVMAQ